MDRKRHQRPLTSTTQDITNVAKTYEMGPQLDSRAMSASDQPNASSDDAAIGPQVFQ